MADGPTLVSPTGLPLTESVTSNDMVLFTRLDRMYRAPRSLFTFTRTPDLVERYRMVGDEILRAYSETTGLEYQIAANEVARLFAGGVINPRLPPYNCKGDAQRAKGVTWTAGSNRLEWPGGHFSAGDVGKFIGTSNSGPGYTPQQGTITSVLGPTEILVSFTAAVNLSAEIIWGTDDTVGMAQALADAKSPSNFVYGGVVDLGVGWYLVGPQVNWARSAIVGRGMNQSGLMRKPTMDLQAPSWPKALLRNQNVRDDFQTILNVGLDGARYCQIPGYSSRCLEFFSVGAGDSSLPQVDPYPFWSGVGIFEAGWDGIATENRFSGDLLAIVIRGCWGFGLKHNAYDANINNLLAIATKSAGVWFQSANNNAQNIKCSFNGDQGGTGGQGTVDDSCCILITSSGNNLTNVRTQECPGDSVVLKGPRNTLGDFACDDTGCMRPEHGQGPQTLRPVRAGVRISGGGAVDNKISVKVSYNVHTGQYATHAVFTDGDSDHNFVEVFYPHDYAWSALGAASSGPAAPGVKGTSSSGGFGANNRVMSRGALI